MEDGDTEKYHPSSVIQDFEFSSRKSSCIKSISLQVYNKRIYHECEGWIENSVPMIIRWRHEACRVMTKSDQEGRIFVSHPNTNNGFFK